MGETEWDLTTAEKFTYLALVVALEEKKPPDFISICKTFSTSGKVLSKFRDLFTNSGLCKKTRGGAQYKVLYLEAQPRGPTTHPFIYHF